MISNKYITGITLALITVILILCVAAMSLPDLLSDSASGYTMEYEQALFDTDSIIDINIIMDDESWEEMLANARQEVYYKCDVVINGTTFYQVGIRPKGNTSLSSIAGDPNNNRYSFKLEFDQFVDGQTCFGLDKLILNNNYADTTTMKEAIIYDMFQYLDADASLYNYAKISVNSEYWGVYLALEAVEESFMLRNYGNEMGYLYKPDSMDMGRNNGKENSKNNFPSMPEGGFSFSGGDFKMPEGGFSFPEGDFSFPEGDFKMPEDGFSFGNSSETTADASKADSSSPDAESSPVASGANKAPSGRSEDSSQRGGFGGRMGGGSNLGYSDDNTDSYTTIWNSQVNDSSEADHKRVVTALKNIHGGTDIEKYIDVDQILKYMAVHNFSVNDDSLSGSMAHNYYLYEANGRISLLPWDYNLAFGGMHGGEATSVVNDPIHAYWSSTTLLDFVFDNPEYKQRYNEYYNKLVTGYLYGGEFEKTYNRIRTQTEDLVKTDPNSMYTYDEYIEGVEALYKVVMLRAQSIKGQLDGSIPSTTEGQRENSSALVDASDINISDMGQFMGGGMRRPSGGSSGGGKQDAIASPDADIPTDSGSDTGTDTATATDDTATDDTGTDTATDTDANTDTSTDADMADA